MRLVDRLAFSRRLKPVQAVGQESRGPGVTLVFRQTLSQQRDCICTVVSLAVDENTRVVKVNHKTRKKVRVLTSALQPSCRGSLDAMGRWQGPSSGVSRLQWGLQSGWPGCCEPWCNWATACERTLIIFVINAATALPVPQSQGFFSASGLPFFPPIPF